MIAFALEVRWLRGTTHRAGRSVQVLYAAFAAIAEVVALLRLMDDPVLEWFPTETFVGGAICLMIGTLAYLMTRGSEPRQRRQRRRRPQG
jgi:hypothetical protein